MSENETSSLRLSYEELVFLLRAMDFPNLPGMGTGPWKELTDPMADVLIQTTGRALLSRGLAGPGEGDHLVIDPALEAMLHACVHPEQMLILTYQNGEIEKGQYWYYRVKEFAVRQEMVAPWVYQFDLSAKTDWGWEIVEGLLKACPVGSMEVTQVLSAERFEQVRQAAARGAAEEGQPLPNGEQLLVESGMAPEAARRLFCAMQAAPVRLHLQYTFQVNPQVQQDGMTLLADAESCWLVNRLPGDAQVTVSSHPAGKVRAILKTAHERMG